MTGSAAGKVGLPAFLRTWKGGGEDGLKENKYLWLTFCGKYNKIRKERTIVRKEENGLWQM